MEYNNNPIEQQHGRIEQIVSQFLLKTLHIILDSRVPSIRPSSRGGAFVVKKTDKWFNLALGDRPSSLDSLTFWHRNLMEPMIIEIILVVQDNTTSGYRALLETVVERWVVRYEHSSSSTSSSPPSSYKKTYKKSIILLRSLFTIMRLLPAYSAFRKLSLYKSTCDFDINYRVSSFTAPFTRPEEQSMKHYTFLPVEAHNGRLSVSVKYRDNLSHFNLDTSASFPTEIIRDYVGSPATDPFRVFPVIIDNNNHNKGHGGGTSFPMQSPQQRPHSWTSGLLTRGGVPPSSTHIPIMQSFGSPPLRSSSASGRYDLSSSPTDVVYGQRNQRNSFDDYSPPFFPSPSPSPPTYLSGGNYMQSRLHSETSAPVSIPRNARYISPNFSDPNRHSLPPQSPRSTRYEISSHESPSGIRSLKKSDMSRIGDLSSGSGSGSGSANANHYSIHKVSRDNKDDSGRFSGLLSSSGSPSPHIGFSRSSSRLSLQDELDDIDFSCPFIVDDVDTCDSPLSQSVGGKQGRELSKKSQDAAVGALVRMLRTAPPLRQDSSCYSSHSLTDGGLDTHKFNTASASGLFMSRKTSDALEELKTFRDIKHLILSKSGIPLVTKEHI